MDRNARSACFHVLRCHHNVLGAVRAAPVMCFPKSAMLRVWPFSKAQQRVMDTCSFCAAKANSSSSQVHQAFPNWKTTANTPVLRVF